MSDKDKAMEAGEGGEGTEEGTGQGPRAPSKKLQLAQAQVDEVVEIMKFNLDKVIERDQKLSNLDDRADALQEGAAQFEKQASTLKNKMWWKNMKMTLIIGGIVLVVIIFLAVNYWPKSSAPGAGPGAPPAENLPPGGATDFQGSKGAEEAPSSNNGQQEPPQEPNAGAEKEGQKKNAN